MVSDKNPLLKDFKTYLELNYSNQKTKDLYLNECKHFLTKIEKVDGEEPVVFTQEILNKYAIFLNSKRNPNPFYKGVCRAMFECFNVDDTLKLKLRKNRSRDAVALNDYNWMKKEDIDKIIEKAPTYISLTVQIFWETALRKGELLNTNLSKKQNNEIGIKTIDLEKRRMIGIGKGNKEFDVHFSKQLADRLSVWLESECKNQTKPFTMHKKNGREYENVDKQYWVLFRKECKKLGIKLANGDDVTVHSLRHSILRWLRREKGFDIETLAKFARHDDPKTTMIYSSSTQEELTKKLDDEVFDK